MEIAEVKFLKIPSLREGGQQTMGTSHDYPGSFEVHLTVAVDSPQAADQLQSWCTQRGLKYLRIVLARGQSPDQPMVSWRQAGTRLQEVRQVAHDRAAEIEHAGWPVVRVKIEAAPTNGEIPIHDAEVAEHPATHYFEHHLKLLRTVGADRGALLETCRQHGGHLSRNALREPVDGQEERFVTLRHFGVGRNTSMQRLAALTEALIQAGERVLSSVSDFSVYD